MVENCVYWVPEEVTVDLIQVVHETESLAELNNMQFKTKVLSVSHHLSQMEKPMENLSHAEFSFSFFSSV